MVKISQLPSETAPSLTDPVPDIDTESTTTKRTLLSAIRDLFFSNIPTTAGDGMFDHVVSGGVWTADSAGVNRNASMNAMSIRINGRLIPVAAVTSRTFTASKDTYIDVLDNTDGTGTLVYTEQTTNGVSPALASNSVRIAIVITGPTTIAAASSINQGELDRVLPIASSIAYTVTDSLGNLICPRDPNRKVLGYRQIITNFTSTDATSTLQDITGLSAPFIAPGNRKVKSTLNAQYISHDSASLCNRVTSIREGATVLATSQTQGTAAAAARNSVHTEACTIPTSGLHTYKASQSANQTGNLLLSADSTFGPAYLLIELE